MQVDVHRVQRLGEIDDGRVPGAETASALRRVQDDAVVQDQPAAALLFRRPTAPAIIKKKLL